MAEEWQEAMTVAEIERIIETTEPREMSSNGDRVWTRRMAEALHGRLAAVERTTANDALRGLAAERDRWNDMHTRECEMRDRYRIKLEAAEALLDLYREAVKIDVKMEGPQFMGVNRSALKRAWEADRAALDRSQP